MTARPIAPFAAFSRAAFSLATCALAACALPGCGVTDTGNPPLSPPDPSRLDILALAAGQITIIGEAGAIEPGAGLIRATNLDDDADPVDATVRPDGGFELAIAAEAGDVVRLQRVQGAERSLPIDIDATAAMLVEDALPCLELDPARELALGAIDGPTEGVIAIENRCAEGVTLEVAPRRDTGGVVATLEPSAIEPGGGGVLRVVLGPLAASEQEEVVLLRVIAPSVDRRAITVRAERR
jgi:hypothetical protein